MWPNSWKPTSTPGAGPECEILSEINTSHRLVRGKFFRSSFFQNFAFKQEIGAVGDVQGLLHIVVGDQHADALLAKLVHNLPMVAASAASLPGVTPNESPNAKTSSHA